MSVEESSRQEPEPYTYTITKEKIKEFAIAIGDINLVYTDEKYAKKTRFGGIIAPPTFVTACRFGAPLRRPSARVQSQRSQGVEGGRARAVLHGEQEFEYFQPIKAGDILTPRSKTVDRYTKKGRSGTLDFVVQETVYENQLGEKVVVGRATNLTRR